MSDKTAFCFPVTRLTCTAAAGFSIIASLLVSSANAQSPVGCTVFADCSNELSPSGGGFAISSPGDNRGGGNGSSGNVIDSAWAISFGSGIAFSAGITGPGFSQSVASGLGVSSNTAIGFGASTPSLPNLGIQPRTSFGTGGGFGIAAANTAGNGSGSGNGTGTGSGNAIAGLFGALANASSLGSGNANTSTGGPFGGALGAGGGLGFGGGGAVSGGNNVGGNNVGGNGLGGGTVSGGNFGGGNFGGGNFGGGNFGGNGLSGSAGVSDVSDAVSEAIGR